MAPWFVAKPVRLAMLPLWVAVAAVSGTGSGGAGSHCEAVCRQTVEEMRKEIARLQAEVRALRGATTAARRASDAAASCDLDWFIGSDADVELYRGCRSVRDLRIQGSTNVTSIAGLESLESAENVFVSENLKLKSLAGLESLTRAGRLEIENNVRLSSLVALQGLRSVETLVIRKNARLRSLAGLEGLEGVEEELHLNDNGKLESLTGLEGLTRVGVLWLSYNDGLLSLSGLQGLRIATEVMIGDNAALESLSGLENLTSVDDFVRIFSNGQLTSLAGLGSLESVKELSITGNSKLVSLAGLENLVRAEEVSVSHNAELLSLSGLQNLRMTKEIDLYDNTKLRHLAVFNDLTSLDTLSITAPYAPGYVNLESLAGLESLVTVNKTLELSRMPKLQSLSGLRSLEHAGHVKVHGTGLRSLSGLGNLTSVGELTLRDNGLLQSLLGLGNLTSADRLFIPDSVGLRSLFGLGNLTSVGELTIANTSLQSLLGLESLASAERVWIRDNGALRSLEGLGPSTIEELYVKMSPFGPPLKYLGLRGLTVGRLTFDGSWPSCVTPQERAALVLGVQALNLSVIPELAPTWPQWQPECLREAFGTLSCTRGHPCILPFPGKTSNFTSIFLSGRYTGCGPCPEHRVQGNVAENGVVDLGYVLRDEEPGLRSICRCRLEAGEVERGPVAQLLLRGPRRSDLTTTSCRRGRSCTFSVKGEALERTDRVVLMNSCSTGDPLMGFTASWTAGNVYLLDNPAWHAAPPDVYQVCWRAPCSFTEDRPTCPAPEDRYFHVGEVKLVGVLSRNYTADLGDSFAAINHGIGVANGDRVRLMRTCGEAHEEKPGVLDATSQELVFDFGRLTEDRVQAGLHVLCWCQEHEGMECNAAWHFAEKSGDVRILCPAGEEFVAASGRCQRCPAGRQRLESGLEPCMECAAGQFSEGGSEACEACPDGTVAELAGRSVCVACQAWERADAETAGCSADPAMLILLALFYLFAGAFFALVVHSVKRQLCVVDVSQDQESTILTTLGPHGLSNFGRSSFPLTLRGTGHPGLDTPERPFRARARDAARLELLSWRDEPLAGRLDTSMGTLMLAFPHDLYHQGWPVSVALSLPVLFIAVAVLGGLLVGVGLAMEGLLGGAAVALALAAASAAMRWRPRSTPLQHAVADFKKKLAKQPPTCCEKGPERAIAIGKLHELLDFFRSFIRDRSAYYLESNILRGLTKESQLSYAEFAGAGRVEWFVSHFRGAAFDHFCMALRKHAETVCGERKWTELHYWVCFCSNNQHHIQDELGKGWEESSAYITLKSGHCQGTCMVLDDQALPLTRICCIFELLQTVKLERNEANFQGLLLCTSGGVLNTGSGSVEVAMALAEKVAGLDLSSAQSSSERDGLMIRQQVVTEMGSFDVLQQFIRGEIRNMLVRAQSSANQHFAGVLARLDGENAERARVSV